MQDEEKRYKIIRYRRNGPNMPVKGMGNLTLDEARRYCSRPDTKDPKGRWFDGFTEV
jgi:hypothetical protein